MAKMKQIQVVVQLHFVEDGVPGSRYIQHVNESFSSTEGPDDGCMGETADLQMARVFKLERDYELITNSIEQLKESFGPEASFNLGCDFSLTGYNLVVVTVDKNGRTRIAKRVADRRTAKQKASYKKFLSTIRNVKWSPMSISEALKAS